MTDAQSHEGPRTAEPVADQYHHGGRAIDPARLTEYILPGAVSAVAAGSAAGERVANANTTNLGVADAIGRAADAVRPIGTSIADAVGQAVDAVRQPGAGVADAVRRGADAVRQPGAAISDAVGRGVDAVRNAANSAEKPAAGAESNQANSAGNGDVYFLPGGSTFVSEGNQQIFGTANQGAISVGNDGRYTFKGPNGSEVRGTVGPGQERTFHFGTNGDQVVVGEHGVSSMTVGGRTYTVGADGQLREQSGNEQSGAGPSDGPSQQKPGKKPDQAGTPPGPGSEVDEQPLTDKQTGV